MNFDEETKEYKSMVVYQLLTITQNRVMIDVIMSFMFKYTYVSGIQAAW